MSKRIFILLLTFLFLGIPMFAMLVVPVQAETSWGTPINITQDAKNDYQSTISFDPTQSKFWHVAWVKDMGIDQGSTLNWEICYTNRSLFPNFIRITEDAYKDYNPMIECDDKGLVHIVWVQERVPGEHGFGVSDIMYTNSNNWKVHVNVSRQVYPDNYFPTLDIEKATQVPHIAWASSVHENYDEIYYVKGATGTIIRVTNTMHSYQPSIDLDPENIVHLVYACKESYNGDFDVRYTNSSIFLSYGPVTDTFGYRNVSDKVDNDVDDLRPDIDLDNVNRSQVAWHYLPIGGNKMVHYSYAILQNQLFSNPVAVSWPDGSGYNPSIKVSREHNPVIVYEGIAPQEAVDDICATDYNGTGTTNWVSVDISNTISADESLVLSSIGVLDIDLDDKLITTWYVQTGAAAPNWEVFVCDGDTKGKGIPGFEVFYIWMAFLSVALIWFYLKRKNM